MSVDSFIALLGGVRRTGAGRWSARCPAHDDKTPSLAVRECDDSRLLLKCFAGCDVESILDAMGLTWDAIMPERPIGDNGKRERRPFFPQDVFTIALKEITIATVIACDMHKNQAISEDGYQRLLTACGRLNSIAEAAYGQ